MHVRVLKSKGKRACVCVWGGGGCKDWYRGGGPDAGSVLPGIFQPALKSHLAGVGTVLVFPAASPRARVDKNGQVLKSGLAFALAFAFALGPCHPSRSEAGRCDHGRRHASGGHGACIVRCCTHCNVCDLLAGFTPHTHTHKRPHADDLAAAAAPGPSRCQPAKALLAA